MDYQSYLEGFELASGLKVNFHKSSLIEINFHPTFLELAHDFLHYKIEFVPFRYLGFLVGVNP